MGQVPNVVVRGRHGGNAQQQAPHSSVTGLARVGSAQAASAYRMCDWVLERQFPAVLEECCGPVIPSDGRLKHRPVYPRWPLCDDVREPPARYAIAASATVLRPRESCAATGFSDDPEYGRGGRVGALRRARHG
jgi:hypothetical protein